MGRVEEGKPLTARDQVRSKEYVDELEGAMGNAIVDVKVEQTF